MDDASIQARIDKRIADDPALSPLGITTTVLDGKVLLMGTVKSERDKAQIEKAVKEIKGVKSVDNQIIVSA
jgi:hyperosmotically inducible protein